jgi:hypothetical protein
MGAWLGARLKQEHLNMMPWKQRLLQIRAFGDSATLLVAAGEVLFLRARQ